MKGKLPGDQSEEKVAELAHQMGLPDGYAYKISGSVVNFEIEVDARPGESLLDIAHKHAIPLEGACGGFMVCSTCHVILPQKEYSTFPEPCTREENILEHADDLCDTSRLGCQVKVEKSCDGMRVFIPKCCRHGH